MVHATGNNQTRIMYTSETAVELERIPHNEKLQAWDAADQNLIRHIFEQQLLKAEPRILILNDQFAALSVSLAKYRPCSISDSYLSRLALQHNLGLNSLSPDQVRFYDSLNMPETRFDLILIKIPKSLALLEHQLYSLRPLIDKKTTIVAAGMTRHIHSSTLKLFETILGSTRTSLAWKKSRLILVQFKQDLNRGQSPYPGEFTLNVGSDLKISSHANVFSREKLDAGTRLMIEHIPISEKYQTIIDLGCGNGILGLVAAFFNPESALLFVDESYMAVDSAAKNFASAFAEQRVAEFKVTNCLDDVDSEFADLVVNNPPFHQQNTIGDAIAWQMFKDARRVLKTGGELRVVANRHLAYHAKLKKIFGNCEQVASNGKYVVLSSVKQSG